MNKLNTKGVGVGKLLRQGQKLMKCKLKEQHIKINQKVRSLKTIISE